MRIENGKVITHFGFDPAMACEACVFGRGEHRADCVKLRAFNPNTNEPTEFPFAGVHVILEGPYRNAAVVD